ncbi:DNA recombination protein RmuC [Candidatus Palibaumannia cicadellinicola]|uniref:RmuC domain protein n=1 Tax=Baumannia cicadellinicola subsp. Homalodisca coagulata TaxID=374463 RepID=Q1LU67_BAUCH|nr:DNA recombination protein RmuC [Candidatus Baumannia cicadellinicola]ABF14028.1 RmuC domain protein [Baumannia cicadellinicola str. Hc (Homalodisca coagulata)]MCJ7462006.1 DNA recombination protein RmuC [Candidatus Baumannia cicadellinicola]MCJ7462993.1 DNA recombination protein RmuC [Candidatus Baumannia cicadellinicola]
MDSLLLYSIIGCIFFLLGILISWLIANLLYQNKCLERENKLSSLAQQLQIAYQKLEQKLFQEEQTKQELYSRLAVTEERLIFLDHLRQECKHLSQELRVEQEKNSNLKAELRGVTICLEETKLAAKEHKLLLIKNEQELSSQFENLAYRIVEQSKYQVSEHNQQSIEQLLIPLREQLDGFRRQMQESFSYEARERHTLAHEISNLQQLHIHMAQEALNLTRALKGDNKIQGHWGEIVLSRVLEASGLREGHEFNTQVNLQHDEERRLQPDVIVRLPQGKDVIIDAKMSLVAYERYFNSDNAADRNLALTEHINSLRNHIKQLGKKDYPRLLGLKSLDYILMFIPVEPAFMVAINHHPELISEAQANNIMLVSPTTLLVALRTIHNLWRYEYQSQNAQKIADRATRLYDKFRLFIDDMNHIGQSIEKLESSYQLAIKKLAYGRGNLISQAEVFRKLGVAIKRPITLLPINSQDNSSISLNEQFCSEELEDESNPL